MAYERLSDNKIKGDSLDAFISNLSKTFSNQIALRNAEEENKFNRIIIDQNLPLEDQLSYRQDQFARVSDDPVERKRLGEEIKTLKTRIKQRDFSDEYTQTIMDYNSGITSVDTVIDWLKDQQSTSTDPDVLDAINKELQRKTDEKFTMISNLIDKSTQFALQDKSSDVVQSAISKVTAAKTKALLAGNDTQAGMYDLQLMALNKALTENNIEKDVKNFAVSSVTGYADSTKLLDAYNSKLATASPTSGPIKIGDVTYASSQEFWKYKRDSYISDSGSNGFFGSLNKEMTDKIKTANIGNNLDTNFLSSIGASFNTLATRPELAGYDQRLAATKADALQTGADLISDKILSSYSTSYDLNRAVTDLNNLKTIGVNTTTAFTKILQTAGSIKQGQVDNILRAAQIAMQNDPNLSPEQAINMATSSGAGVVLSPEQLATSPEKTIATDLSKGSTAGAFGNEPRTTTTATPPVSTNIPPVIPAKPAPSPTTPPAPTPSIPINQQLDFGATNPQVKELQKFLNKAGFLVASPGQAGSAGMETDYFGPATQAALQKFQASQGIVTGGTPVTTGYGRLGPQTLAAIQGFKI